jgi:hypothetical protein
MKNRLADFGLLYVVAVMFAVVVAGATNAARAQENVAGDVVPSADAQSTAEPSRDDVLKELEALREKVRVLEQKQTATAEQTERLTQQQVDDAVEKVLTDANKRSQLLESGGFTAGWTNGKFIIQSEDGNYVLNPNFWFQERYILNYREEDANNEVDGGATTEHGFELRRMKFIFEGNAITPKLKYRFEFNTNRNGGESFLEDAYVTYKMTDLLTIKGGQYKEPTFHEELMNATRQLAVERSLVNFTLGGGVTDRVQGVALIIDDGPEGMPFRAEVGYTDGFNSKNTNFVDGGGNAFLGVSSPDFGLYGRAEYIAMGDWKNYDDFTSRETVGQMLVIGGGASYSQAGDNYALLHTVDAQYENGPFGAYAAYLGVASDNETAGSLYDFGVLAQASWLLTSKWEVFGRYEYMNIDSKHGTGDDNYHVLTAGVNYYIKSHSAKFTVDMMYLPNGSPVNNDAAGILNPDSDTDQFVIRGQFQILL